MTPLSKHFAGSDFACRAQGYGFPGAAGRERYLRRLRCNAGRRGPGTGRRGADALECVTYRQRGHCENNPIATCRDMAEVEAWRAKDPLPRLRTDLMRRGILTDPLIARIDAEVGAEI